TGSATVLATATLVALLPQIFFSPFAGALVDRWNRRRVMIVADLTSALATVWMVYLFAVGAAEVWHVYMIMLIRSMAGAFQFPAMQASTSLMVPEQHLARVAGFNQMLQGAISIIAPPMGALLLEALPMQSVLAVDIVTASIAVIPLLFIALPQPIRSTEAHAGEPKPSVLTDLVEGLRYVRGWPGLLIILFMATMINFLFTPAFSLLPLLVREHFDGGALELGWLEAAWGIGIVVGGLTLGIWGGFKNQTLTSMVGLIGMGVGSVIIGAAPGTALAMGIVGMLIGGFMNPITNGPLFALLQSTVDPTMQGRVFTLVGAAATAMSPLSLIVAGPVADALGLRLWYVVAGVFCATMGISGMFIPALMHIEQDMQAEKAEEEAVSLSPALGGVLSTEMSMD
ncbi:MAG TPA: MFS transporter, partial [Aggregatilineaceae bacterium]|nr:MFS transporter [Aggregatilineaceae bacterium]